MGLFNRMKRNRKQRGFTLMEAMMAVFILAVAAAGISMAFAAAGAVQVEAQRKILATRLAADLTEKIVALGYAKIKLKDIYPDGTYSAEAIGCTGAIYEGLSCTLTYSEATVEDGGKSIKLIQMTVVTFYNGREMTRLTTLVGDKSHL